MFPPREQKGEIMTKDNKQLIFTTVPESFLKTLEFEEGSELGFELFQLLSNLGGLSQDVIKGNMDITMIIASKDIKANKY
jgi:hypothetical protein